MASTPIDGQTPFLLKVAKNSRLVPVDDYVRECGTDGPPRVAPFRGLAVKAAALAGEELLSKPFSRFTVNLLETMRMRRLRAMLGAFPYEL
jgi:hypothetical protein